MRGLYFLFVALVVVACNQEAAKKQPAKKAAVLTIQTKTVNAVNDSLDFPVADTLSPVRILTEGTFHNDEVQKKDQALNWIGLFKNGNGCYLAPFKIKITQVRDDIVDSATGPMTGWKVQTGKKDSSTLLMANIDGLTPHTIVPLIGRDTSLSSGVTLNYKLNGVDYKLYATGKQRPDNSIDGKYVVFIDANIHGTSYHQLIEAKQQPEGRSTIYFIGDIDGDGIPDLVMETANHENVEAPTLYLSKPAVKGQLLKMMGMHVTVGC